jgi:hypothetical protein
MLVEASATLGDRPARGSPYSVPFAGIAAASSRQRVANEEGHGDRPPCTAKKVPVWWTRYESCPGRRYSHWCFSTRHGQRAARIPAQDVSLVLLAPSLNQTLRERTCCRSNHFSAHASPTSEPSWRATIVTTYCPRALQLVRAPGGCDLSTVDSEYAALPSGLRCCSQPSADRKSMQPQ